jgi:hypothetical protein
MPELYIRQRHAGSHRYPKFLPYSPDEETGWIVEDFDPEKAETEEGRYNFYGEYEGLYFNLGNTGNNHEESRYSVYRNAKTKRLMNLEDAAILRHVYHSWHNEYDSGHYWFHSDERQDDGEMLIATYSLSDYSPTANTAAFPVMVDYLKESPFEENEHWFTMSETGMNSNGGFDHLVIVGWDKEKQEPTDMIRWFAHSDLLEYLLYWTSFCRYTSHDGTDFDWEVFVKPDEIWSGNMQPLEDCESNHARTRYKEYLQYVFDEDWWSKSLSWHDWKEDADETEALLDELVDVLHETQMWSEGYGNNDFHFAMKDLALNWFSPLVAGQFDCLEPLEDIDEDEFLPEVTHKYSNREYILKAWRKWYTLCLQAPKFDLHEIAWFLQNEIPNLSYEATSRRERRIIYTLPEMYAVGGDVRANEYLSPKEYQDKYGSNPPDKVRHIPARETWKSIQIKDQIRFYEEWPAHKIVAMTEELCSMLESEIENHKEKK